MSFWQLLTGTVTFQEAAYIAYTGLFVGQKRVYLKGFNMGGLGGSVGFEKPFGKRKKCLPKPVVPVGVFAI